MAVTRRADFLMALAYATDLATGHSRDFALRSCVLAMRLAEVAGPRRRDRAATSITRRCCATSAAMPTPTCWRRRSATRSRCAGTCRASTSATSRSSPRRSSAPSRAPSPDAPPAELAKAVERGLAEAMQVSVPILSGHCEVAQRIAERIGLSDEIRENLGQLYERWDGKGLPRGLSGNAVKLPVRLVTLAQDAIALTEAHGFETMKAMIAKRAGGGYEPELADLFVAHAERCWPDSTGPSIARRSWRSSRVPHAMLDEDGLRGSLSGHRRHDRHADAVHVRPFARRGVAGRCGGQAHGSSRLRHSRRPLGGLYARHRRTGDAGLDLDASRRADRTRDRRGAASSLPRRARAGVAGRRRQGGRGAGAAPSRAARRQRLSPLRARQRPLARRPHPRRRRSLPDRAGGAALPAGARAMRPRPRNCAAPSRTASSAPTRSRRCSPAPVSRRAGPRPSAWRD